MPCMLLQPKLQKLKRRRPQQLGNVPDKMFSDPNSGSIKLYSVSRCIAGFINIVMYDSLSLKDKGQALRVSFIDTGLMH